jgi:hypothetical protein
MTEDPVAKLLVKSLRDLVHFVDTNPEDATEEDDIRGLESVALRRNGSRRGTERARRVAW